MVFLRGEVTPSENGKVLLCGIKCVYYPADKVCKAKKFGCGCGIYHPTKALSGLIPQPSVLKGEDVCFFKMLFCLTLKDHEPK